MKNKANCFLIFLSIILLSQVSKAQLVSGDIFLQGNYVEVGIAPNGSFGSANYAPAGYHPRTSAGVYSGELGFVADPDRDGFSVGSPDYYGDYFVPGTPQEGWAIGVGTSYYEAYRSAGATSFTSGLTGSNVSYVDSGYTKKGIWQGTISASNLNIRQVTSLKPNDLFFTTYVYLKNTGSSTLHDIYFNRTVDPDNDVTLSSGSFVTDNKIVNTLPNPNNKVLVQALATVYTSAYLGLGTKDGRAKAYVLDAGLVPTSDLSQIYSGTGSAAFYHYDTTTTYTNDVGIGLIYKIDSLEAGDSTVLGYAYVLGPAYIDTAFADLSAVLPLNFISFDASAKKCSVELNWNYNTDEKIEGFTIERSLDGRTFAGVATVGANCKSFIDPTVFAEKTLYRIKAKTIGQKYYYSGTAIINGSDCATTTDLSISPNPAKTSISINTSLQQNDAAAYTIKNSLGQKMMEGEWNKANNTIDIRNVSNGADLFEIIINNTVMTARFTVSH